MKSAVSVFDPSALYASLVSGPMRRDLRRVPRSKPNPRGLIGDFAGLAIACLHGHADQRSGPGRPKRTPNPHRAGARSDRAAPSNCSAGAQPNSAPQLPSYRSAVLDPAVALVAAIARKPADRSARDRLTLAPWRLVSDMAISVVGSLARWAS